jgi:hypothetical protein
VPEVGNVLGPARFNTLIGVVFLVIVLLSPGGLIGIYESARDRIRRRRSGTGGEGTSVTAGGRESDPATGTVS